VNKYIGFAPMLTYWEFSLPLYYSSIPGIAEA